VGPNTTDGNGEATYSDLPDDTYKAKTYYQGKWFWSPLISYPAEYLALINITVTDIEVLVYLEDTPLEGQAVHCYTDTNVYIGPGTTNSSGRTEWELSDGDYKCKTYYQGKWFWTEVFSVPDNTSINLTIEQQSLYVSVNVDDEPLEGQTVHLYTDANVYIGPNTTDENGMAEYSLTEGSYKAKTYYQGKWFWSDVVSYPAENHAYINISSTTVEVFVYVGETPLEGQVVHCYTDTNVYIGPGTTNEEGRSEWELSDGDYKCKTYYQGKWFWTEVFSVPDNTSVNLTIEQQMFYVSVRAGDNPLENQHVHLYTEANVYVGPEYTNVDGIATYSLTEGNYKAKTYYQGKWFWSDVGNTSLTDTVNITIRLTDVPVYVMDDGVPLEGYVVHCYTDTNVYIGPQTTNEEGRSDWELSDGDYKCKTYHEGEWLWTDTFTVPVILNV
jgi:hypothetical protein